jgi:glucose/arabinose dehydrogenase
MKAMRSVGWKAIVGAIVVLVLVGGGTGAAVCKFSDLACGLNPAPTGPTRDSLDDFGQQGRGEMSLEDGLTATTVVSNLRYPTDLDFLPDGRVLIAEKDGVLRIVEDGNLRRRPFLDVRDRVNTHFFRGIVNVTVDPDFPRRPYLYLVYAVRGQGGQASSRPTAVRLSRFTVRDDVALAGTERVLVGTNAGSVCASLRRVVDCIAAVGTHIGSDIVFAPDGTMYVSTGDGAGEAERVERAAFSAQDVNSLNGKILRIDRAGRGLPANPYWNGNPDANRSKVWAKGLRNPFRIEIVQGRRDALLVADVGWDAYDELTVVERGSDHGWPCYEGPERAPKYSDDPRCAAYFARSAAPVEPWLAIPHVDERSITGGLHMGPAKGWPDGFEDHYVFGDWATSEIFAIPSNVAAPAAEPRTVASNAAGPVAFARAADGLYFLSVNTGELRRIAPG